MNSGPIENHMIIVWSALTVLELIFMYFRQQLMKFFFSEYLWKFLLQWLLHLSLLPFLPWRSVRKYWHQSPEQNNSKWLENNFENFFLFIWKYLPQDHRTLWIAELWHNWVVHQGSQRWSQEDLECLLVCWCCCRSRRFSFYWRVLRAVPGRSIERTPSKPAIFMTMKL